MGYCTTKANAKIFEVTRIEKTKYKFVATGDTESFNKLARRFLGPEVHSVEGKI